MRTSELQQDLLALQGFDLQKITVGGFTYSDLNEIIGNLLASTWPPQLAFLSVGSSGVVSCTIDSVTEYIDFLSIFFLVIGCDVSDVMLWIKEMLGQCLLLVL